jgi:hypothetical protein
VSSGRDVTTPNDTCMRPSRWLVDLMVMSRAMTVVRILSTSARTSSIRASGMMQANCAPPGRATVPAFPTRCFTSMATRHSTSTDATGSHEACKQRGIAPVYGATGRQALPSACTRLAPRFGGGP